MVYSAKSDDVNTISQFTRRKDIKITTGGTSTPVNYQTKVTIAYEPGMQATFADIRFNTKAGTYIDYWIESKTDSDTADIWLELPDAITDPGSDTVWMYYGNAAASDASNGTNTFIQWHGAATANYQYTNIISIPFIWEGKFRRTSDVGWFMIGISNQQASYPIGVGDDSLTLSAQDSLRHYVIAHNDGVESYSETWPIFTLNEYYRTRIVAISSSSVIFHPRTIGTTYELTTNIPNEAVGLNLYLYQGANAEQEFSFIRKYIANEPTVSYGTAQHQRRTPQFM